MSIVHSSCQHRLRPNVNRSISATRDAHVRCFAEHDTHLILFALLSCHFAEHALFGGHPTTSVRPEFDVFDTHGHESIVIMGIPA